MRLKRPACGQAGRVTSGEGVDGGGEVGQVFAVGQQQLAGDDAGIVAVGWISGLVHVTPPVIRRCL